MRKEHPYNLPSEGSGSDPYQQKRDQLIQHLSIVLVIGAVLYFVLDRAIFRMHVPVYIFASAFLIGVGTFLLNKFGKRDLSKIIGLLLFNAMIYSLTSSESRSTNLFLFLGVGGLSALALFGYEERWKAYGFAFLPLLLSLASYLSSYSPLPLRTFTENQVIVFSIINTVTASYCAVYIIMLLLRINYRAESQLRSSILEASNQNRELEKTNAELDQFMYSTSHDLRAPLSSLKGLIHLSELSKELPEIREYVHLMKGSIQSLEKFTLDITDHYRNSRTESVFAEVILHIKIEEVIKNLSFLDNTKRIKFLNKIGREVTLYTDPSRLSIILNNIISNSIKYSDPDKSDSFVTFNYRLEEDKHAIEIQDNGIGIEEQRLNKVFDMFYRASELSKGSGLGLYIVKETIEKLHGEVRVHSVVGEGTTFTLVLPVDSV